LIVEAVIITRLDAIGAQLEVAAGQAKAIEARLDLLLGALCVAETSEPDPLHGVLTMARARRNKEASL